MPQLDEHSHAPLDAVLAEVVQGLHEELARLRSAIDELRDEIQSAVGVKGSPPCSQPALRITSLPNDPAAPDFFDRINAVPPGVIEALRAEVARSASRADTAST